MSPSALKTREKAIKESTRRSTIRTVVKRGVCSVSGPRETQTSTGAYAQPDLQGETVKGEVVQPAAVAGTVVTQPGSGVPPGCAPGGHCRRLCGNHRSPRHRRYTVDPQGRRTSTAASSPGSSASSAAGASSAAPATRGRSTTRRTARRSWRRERRAASSSLRGINRDVASMASGAQNLFHTGSWRCANSLVPRCDRSLERGRPE